MSNVITPARVITCVEHSVFFEDADCPGAGYAFTCSPDGEILPPEHEAARESLARCIANPTQHVRRGVEDYTRAVEFAKVIRCDCGGEVALFDSWSNGCDLCPREYNSSGQKLAPRSQWGSEWIDKPEEDWGLY